MKKPTTIIQQLRDWLLDSTERSPDYYLGSDNDDEDYIDPWNLDDDPWNLDYDPWKLDRAEPNWLDRLGGFLYALFHRDD